MAAKRTLEPHQGVMAHRIIYKGVEHELAIARIEGREVVVRPYAGRLTLPFLSTVLLRWNIPRRDLS